MTVTQHDRNALRPLALQQIYDALEAQHAPPFAAAFLDQFWQQVADVVARLEATLPPDRIVELLPMTTD